jgi:hypothetical protein
MRQALRPISFVRLAALSDANFTLRMQATLHLDFQGSFLLRFRPSACEILYVRMVRLPGGSGMKLPK